ncbi:MAG: tryptophan-rich sensory protein [Candidatus Izemoplasmatales bacterium]|jgi:hypothetical protein|nr:tryptophan-rich sensory protein [bacterium]MDZ4196364.1 tryptophan-rich sensory protein [Candidatus Izemoplasmatales bacterium]
MKKCIQTLLFPKNLVFITAITYGLMVFVNALANIIPINNITTGEVSDSYFNLFAPTGLTFSIWGLIYVLLGWYVYTQLKGINAVADPEKQAVYSKVNLYFSLSSIANFIWIFAWHYRVILLSLLLMLFILVMLILISFQFKKVNTLTKVTFGIYFGWITVATIANVTTYLVRLGLPNNTVGANLQTIVILLVGVVIGLLTLWIQKNVGYGLVLAWAYLGIYLKHIDPNQFDYGYISIVNTSLVGMIILLAFSGFTLWRNLKLQKQ